VVFPVAITNVFPLENDPFGVSYLELIIDKQGAMNKLYNASMQKELRNA